MDNVRLEGAGFVELSRALKAAGEGELRKHLLKEIRAEAKPVLDDMRRQVLALDSSAKNNGGGLARAKRTAKAVGKAESAFGYSDRQIERAGKRGGGLRQAVAKSLRIAVRDTGFKVGVRIKTERTRLPADQAYLPRGLDSVKGWRHPVFKTGDWVTQYGNPPGWFMSTAKAHRPMVQRRIENVVRDYARVLASRANRAA